MQVRTGPTAYKWQLISKDFGWSHLMGGCSAFLWFGLSLS